jgi:tetratricopeptide (TPR) repeat protein
LISATQNAECKTELLLGQPFPDLYCNRSEIRRGCDDIDEALADFDHMLELNLMFIPVCLDLAGLLADIGHLDAVELAAVARLRLAPDSPRLLAVLGQIHAERADYDAAFAAFDRALMLDPDLVVALSGRAALAYRVDDWEHALADLERAIQLAPDDPAPRFGRALVLQEMGHWDEALADLDAAASLARDDPGHPSCTDSPPRQDTARPMSPSWCHGDTTHHSRAGHPHTAAGRTPGAAMPAVTIVSTVPRQSMGCGRPQSRDRTGR